MIWSHPGDTLQLLWIGKTMGRLDFNQQRARRQYTDTRNGHQQGEGLAICLSCEQLLDGLLHGVVYIIDVTTVVPDRLRIMLRQTLLVQPA